MEIREATYNDYEQIARLHSRSWRLNLCGVMTDEYLSQEVEDDRKLIWQARLINPSINQHVIVVEDEGYLCAFICAFGNHDFEKGSIIESMHVAPEYQNLDLKPKLLKAMLQWIEQFFPDMGVYTEVVDHNRVALEFYEQLGGTYTSDKTWHTPCDVDIAEHVYTWPTPKAMLQAID